MPDGWLPCVAGENHGMNWNSAADFFAMGGYGFFVWTSYAVCAACMLAEPLLARQRHRQRACTTPRSKPQTPRRPHETPSQEAGRHRWPGVCGRHHRRAGAQRLPEQPGVLLFAHPGGGQGSPGGAHLPRRRPGRGRLGEGGRHAGAVRHHRHRQDRAGALQRHPARPVQGGQRRGRPGPAARKACSSPARCWPNTTRTTCRPRPPRR